MERTPVQSSVLTSVGYDPATKTLEVEFRRTGQVYAYFPVPESLYAEMRAADSIGTFFDTRIRHHYIYREQNEAIE